MYKTLYHLVIQDDNFLPKLVTFCSTNCGYHMHPRREIHAQQNLSPLLRKGMSSLLVLGSLSISVLFSEYMAESIRSHTQCRHLKTMSG